MTPEQAMQYLMNVLVLKEGLTIQDAAGVVQAWNVLAEYIKPRTPPRGLINEELKHDNSEEDYKANPPHS